jgi:hypothetical protein
LLSPSLSNWDLLKFVGRNQLLQCCDKSISFPHRQLREEFVVVLVGKGRQLGYQHPAGGSQANVLKTAIAGGFSTAHKILLNQAFNQFEMAPRVNPVAAASALGDVALASNISRSTTHSAVVTPLPTSFRAKPWET